MERRDRKSVKMVTEGCNTVTVMAAQEMVYEEAFSPKRGWAVVASVKTRTQTRKKSDRTPAIRNGNAFLWMMTVTTMTEDGERDEEKTN